MTEPLAPELRKQLEKAVRDARRLGEAGARAALRALAVHESRPYEGVSEDERALRRRLRAHGRQLGDEPNRQSGTQAIRRLGPRGGLRALAPDALRAVSGGERPACGARVRGSGVA